MRISWGPLAFLLIVGCTGGASENGAPGASSSGSSSDAPHPCSPLDAVTEPIALENVVGAGRHADGTIYVLDRGRPESRAFVSEGSVLQRKKVAGSGSGADWEVATVSDPNAPVTLKVESANGVAKRMGVFRGELKDKSFEIGVQGDVLELVDPSAYANLPVRNIAGSVVVEYDASTSDERRLVVLRPDIDWSYEDFRVFFGTRTRMVERPVRNVSRGSSTYIAFDVDGVEHLAVFASPFSSSTVSTLTVNGQQENLSVNKTELGADVSYFCR